MDSREDGRGMLPSFILFITQIFIVELVFSENSVLSTGNEFILGVNKRESLPSRCLYSSWLPDGPIAPCSVLTFLSIVCLQAECDLRAWKVPTVQDRVCSNWSFLNFPNQNPFNKDLFSERSNNEVRYFGPTLLVWRK